MPPLFKSHFSSAKGVTSLEGFHCIHMVEMIKIFPAQIDSHIPAKERLLLAAGRTDHPLCNFCNTEPNNLINIYVTCSKTQEF